MQYNAVDQLSLWPGMYAYEYDNAGNLQTVRARNASGPIVASYTYYRNGLLETATHGDTALANTWDTLGNRVQVSVTKGGLTETHNFVYNPLAGVPAVIVESKSGGKTYYYYRDPSGVLIARRDAAVSDSWQYYHYDELGSTRLITNKDGVVTDSYAYDAYGGTIAHNGGTTDNPYQYVGALGYYTHHQDPEFRLLQLGFRFYDPETGRFTQQDPIGAGINWYAYCGGNPINHVDPTGTRDYKSGDQCSWGYGEYLIDNSWTFTVNTWDWTNTRAVPWLQEALGPVGMGGAVAGWGIDVGAGALSWVGAKLGLRGTPAVGNAGIATIEQLGWEEANAVIGSGGEHTVYGLLNSGRVYIGRTINFVQRIGHWGTIYGEDLTAVALGRGLSYSEARGLEQFFINGYLSDGVQLINRINGISPRNSNLDFYLNAAWSRIIGGY